MLTLRMLLVTFVGLYTSRIVLSTLGVTDYGVYSVAGSFIGIISFINTTMAGATNRFLCLEMGKDNSKYLSQVFSSALIIHICIAILVFILAETVGLWFLNHELNIPSTRMYAANWVYQFSIISVIISITQTPYSAVILAREKMNIYAYFEILNVLLKLLIIALLVILPGDKLIIYAFLITSVSLLMRILNRIYCMRHFEESRFVKVNDKTFFSAMLNFSLTDLFGNICYIGYEQSRPILLNIFFGVIYNTAASLSYTIQSLISAFASTITQAFRPQIIKLYASKNLKLMQQTMENALKFNIIIFALISVPCIFESRYILSLWLNEIPPHLILFLRIILSTSIIAPLSGICVTAIHASGNIKKLSYITGTLYILIPLIIWIVFRNGCAAWWMFVIYGIIMLFICSVDIYLVKQNINDFNTIRFIRVVFSTYAIIIISILPNFGLNLFMESSFIRCVLSAIMYLISVSGLAWLILFSSEERGYIKNILKNKLSLLHR